MTLHRLGQQGNTRRTRFIPVQRCLLYPQISMKIKNTIGNIFPLLLELVIGSERSKKVPSWTPDSVLCFAALTIASLLHVPVSFHHESGPYQQDLTDLTPVDVKDCLINALL